MKKCKNCNIPNIRRITVFGITVCLECLKGVKYNEIKKFILKIK